MDDFSTILMDLQSSDRTVRSKVEAELQYIFDRKDPSDLDPLLISLNQDYDPGIKLSVVILVKKILDICINEMTINAYREYISSRKFEIVNLILNSQVDKKTFKFLVIVLGQCLSLFIDTFNHNKNNNSLSTISFTYDEVLQYLFENFSYHKDIGNSQDAFHAMFIAYKLIKILTTMDEETKKYLHCNYYKYNENIISHFRAVSQAIIDTLENNIAILDQNSMEMLYYNFQYEILYIKWVYSVENLISYMHREVIVNCLLDILKCVFKCLNNIRTNSRVNNQQIIFECVFWSYKLFAKFSKHLDHFDLEGVKRLTENYSMLLSDHVALMVILQMVKESSSHKSNRDRNFLMDVIDFVHNLLKISCDIDTNLLDLESINPIWEYLTKEYFTIHQITDVIKFVIQNCMIFRPSEIQMAQNDVEEFYQWYDSLSTIYDLREKAGLLCRIIYEKFSNQMTDFDNSIELCLLNLTKKEYRDISPEEMNLKCALLAWFETMTFAYFTEKRNYNIWVQGILLAHFDYDININNPFDVFSRFIILRILKKIIPCEEIGIYQREIFIKIYQLLLQLKGYKYYESNYSILLKFAVIDFFHSFINMTNNLTNFHFPEGFLENFILSICEVLQNTSSPDIHCKIIQTTLEISQKFSNEEIECAFPLIFPVLRNMWDSNCTTQCDMIYSNNHLSVPVLRQNVIKLLMVFVKSIGVFFNNKNDDQLFQFMYNVIGYSISIKSNESTFLVQEAIKLILLIQDQLYVLLKKNEGEFMKYFLKIFDYLPIIIENLCISDDYFIAELFLIEQYVSLISNQEVRETITSLNLIDNIIYIIRIISEKHMQYLHQMIFNFIEYCIYIFNSIGDWEGSRKFNLFVCEMMGNLEVRVDENMVLAELDGLDVSSNICESQCLELYLGYLQLANRMIIIDENISYELFVSVIKKINFIRINFDRVSNYLSFLSRQMLTSLIQNLIIITNHFAFADVQNSIQILRSVPCLFTPDIMFYNNTNTNSFASHRLFFFNILTNSSYHNQFSKKEEIFRQMWLSKLEKSKYSDVDLTDVTFELKSDHLKSDLMWKSN